MDGAGNAAEKGINEGTSVCVNTVAFATSVHTLSQVCPTVFVALRPWLCGQSTDLISLDFGSCPLVRTVNNTPPLRICSSIITQEDFFF